MFVHAGSGVWALCDGRTRSYAGRGWTLVADVMGVMGSMISSALERALGDLCLRGKAD